METRVGKLLGRYQIVAELGRGAMGVVYKAWDPKIERFVAIKTISLSQADPRDQQDYRNRFFIEAQAAGRLLHPGIVALFDIGEEPETSDPFIVMEYIEGQTLRDLLDKGRRALPLDRALQIAEEVAEALDYAHAQGVVHRDIKPANILLATDGQAKISDFGIAQLDLSHITLPGHVVGTPAFMSPEQLEGEQVDGRSDLFSLGAILYCMVTGFSPFQGNSARTVCFKVANRDPLQPTALAPELPYELDEVVARALTKDPVQRYQSGLEMASDLHQLREKRHHALHPESSTLWFSRGEGRTIPQDDDENARSSPANSGAAKSGPAAPAKRKSSSSLLPPVFSSPLRIGAVALLLSGVAIGFIALRQHNKAAQTSGTSLRADATQPPAAPVETKPPSPPVSHTRKSPPKNTHATHALSHTADTTGTIPQAPHEPLAVANSKPPGLQAADLKVADSSVGDSSRVGSKVADSNVAIEIDNRFADATLSFWIDDKLAYVHPLHDGHKNRLPLLGRGVKEKITIPLTAGKHELRIRVQSGADQYEESRSISGDFDPGGEKTLAVNFEKHTRQMLLSLH